MNAMQSSDESIECEMKTEMAEYPRRDFLKIINNVFLAATGLLGVGGLMRYLSFSAEPPPKTEFALGSASNYPIGSRTLLRDVPVMLIHNEDGFSALSLVCPHLGCTVEDGEAGFICPCHGSRFDAQGVLQRGPAQQSLRSLRIETTADGQLELFLN